MKIVKCYLNKSFCLLIIVLFQLSANAQSKGSVLVVPTSDSKIVIDGSVVGTALKDKPQKFDLDAGEHYIQAISSANSALVADQIVTIEAGKQKVVKMEFAESNTTVGNGASTDEILVADLGFTVPGILAVSSWKSNNGNKEYPNYPDYYYAFEKGDVITLDFSMANVKGTNSITVTTFPGNAVKYTNTSFSVLTGVKITVSERSIYHFTLSTNSAFDRRCRLVIKRIPASTVTAGFNSNVSKRLKVVPKEVQSLQTYYINSAMHPGGKTRVLLQLDLPKNTVQWYYRYTAYRKQAQIEQRSKDYKLITEITKTMTSTSPAGDIIGFAVSELAKPPAADYCDVYLLDNANTELFLNKNEACKYCTDGTRQNMESGIVEVKAIPSNPCFLGLKNPSMQDGINVDIEVVAVVKELSIEMGN